MLEPILYPKAIWTPLAPDHYTPGTLEQRNTIVMHITEGPTAAGAIETFKTSVAPHRTSAHFVIDRDGTVYQLVGIRDTAWHASQVNAHSIGIEHAALSEEGADALNKLRPSGPQHTALPATDAQYQASAELVAWLCQQLSVTCDRAHIREHCEASPRDNHALCCHGALNIDKVVEMASSLLNQT